MKTVIIYHHVICPDIIAMNCYEFHLNPKVHLVFSQPLYASLVNFKTNSKLQVYLIVRNLTISTEV